MQGLREIGDSTLDSILQAIQVIENKKYVIDDNAKCFLGCSGKEESRTNSN